MTILENSSNTSGLKLNTKNCQVLRRGASKNVDTAYMKNRKFQWSSIEARALSLIFTNIKTDVMKFNIEKNRQFGILGQVWYLIVSIPDLCTLTYFEICLKQWHHRKLTLIGKVTVVKKIALPKIIFAFLFLQNRPKSTIDRIEKIMYSFIWDGKLDKLKRSTLIQNYEKGGIKMINIEHFIMSLNVTSIKKILDTCSHNNGV